MSRRVSWFFLAALILSGCQTPEPAACQCAERELRLATTSSVDNTGLLGKLLPGFSQRTGIQVKVLAVGTGKALELARRGDVDAVLVHDRMAEEEFVASGHGVNRRLLMHNDFVLLGPAADPAGVKGTKDVAAALATIADKGATFVSRGDKSGTHRKEQQLWAAAAKWPAEQAWYLEAGQGMRPTLTVADQKGAYCLSDRGTYLFAADKIALKVLVEGDARLHNPYHFIAVSPAKNPKAHYVEAMALVGYLTSVEGQAIIGGLKIAGQTLFHPDALSGG